MTVQRVGCAARLLYRDRHLCVDSWWIVTAPDGQTYELCSGACLLTFAVYGALPAAPKFRAEPRHGATPPETA
jgi:hypothetical protein